MKLWKITAKRDHTLTFFLSPEALYDWLSDGARFEVLAETMFESELRRLTLKKGDELYAEWLGSEYVYDDKEDRTYTLKTLKLVSFKQLEQTWKPTYVEGFECWVSDEIMRLDPDKETTKSKFFNVSLMPSEDQEVNLQSPLS
jgi:hypothetical protein